MRNFGWLLILAGIVGFLYCSDRLGKVDPLPEGLSISQSLERPAGQLELGRYASGAAAAFGILVIMATGRR